MRQQYQLSWSTGTEKIDTFTRFFDYSRSLDVMLDWLKEAIQVLPSQYTNLLLFCTLTGMRGSEVVEAVRLLIEQISDAHASAGGTLRQEYYNPESKILHHYLYPNIFIRKTKAV